MKNMKLGVKLTGGFTLTALIILAVGITAMVEQRKILHLQNAIITDDLPAIKYILEVKNEVSQIAGQISVLLSPNVTRKKRIQIHKLLDDSKRTYQNLQEDLLRLNLATQLTGEINELNQAIKLWESVNNRAVELSEQLIEMDILNPPLLNATMGSFETAHQSLLAKLGKLVAFNEPFEGGTDHNACSLGKWLANTSTSNEQLSSLASELRPIHENLHKNVIDIKKAVNFGNNAKARDILINTISPLSEKVFAIVNRMNQESDGALRNFQEMDRLLLVDAEKNKGATFQVLDGIIHKIEAIADKTVIEGQTIAKTSRVITITGMIIGIVLALLLGIILTISITRPLSKGVELSRAMANGDLTGSIDINQSDEVGILAKSLSGMASGLRDLIKDVNKGIKTVDDSANSLSVISSQMSTGAEETANRASQVATAAEEMSANQHTIAAAMEEASINVNMVATAADEMNATITEIAQNSTKAQNITDEAVQKSQKASERVNELGAAADEINKVTEVITEISEQTNLLALNATIEAARAGDAGKGFAVVANEIKDLAKQTAEATHDIKQKIQGIQQATGITVKEINEIASVISDVDQIVETIAVAVEEQAATTREIADNVNQASSGIVEVNENIAQNSTVASEIASDIAGVSHSAEEINSASSRVKESAEELTAIADKLKKMMSRFTT